VVVRSWVTHVVIGAYKAAELDGFAVAVVARAAEPGAAERHATSQRACRAPGKNGGGSASGEGWLGGSGWASAGRVVWVAVRAFGCGGVRC